MKEKLKKFLTESKKMSAEEAEKHLAGMPEDSDEFKKLAAECDDEEKRLAAEADEAKAKLAAEKDAEDKRLAAEKEVEEKRLSDEKVKAEEDAKLAAAKAEEEAKLAAKKLADEKEEEEKKAKLSAAKDNFVKLAKGINTLSGTVRLEAKKAHISTRLARLRAEAKITPAEVKKMDLTKLASANDATIDAVLKTYQDREPVIDTSSYGTAKGESIAKITEKYRLAKIEHESRMNMPSKRKSAKEELKRLAEAEEKEIASFNRMALGSAVSQDETYAQLAKMVDEGADPVRLKAAVKEVLAVRLSAAAGSDESHLSALAENLKQVQTQFQELITLVGTNFGVESKDLT